MGPKTAYAAETSPPPTLPSPITSAEANPNTPSHHASQPHRLFAVEARLFVGVDVLVQVGLVVEAFVTVRTGLKIQWVLL